MQAQYSSAEMVRILITAKDTVQATVYVPAVAPKAVLVCALGHRHPAGFLQRLRASCGGQRAGGHYL